MCLVLLPTSLAQHSHSYGMDSEIPELHCHLHTVFCIGHNFETIISGEMLGTPTQCHKVAARAGAEGVQAPPLTSRILMFIFLVFHQHCKSRSGALQNILWQYHKA